jgi:hypothetical protein
LERRFESSFDSVIGGTGTQKQKARERLDFLLNDFREERFAPYEVTKSPRDQEIIDAANAGVDKIARQYGADPKSLPGHNVYVLRPAGVEAVSNGQIHGGFHTPVMQRIVVERKISDIDFEMTLAHETTSR